MRLISLYRCVLTAVTGSVLLLSPLAVSTGPSDTRAVRPAVKAGSWYPANPAKLGVLVDTLLDEAPADPVEKNTAIRALIVPHAAYAYSGTTAAAAYRLIKGRSYRRVILLGPAHRALRERGLYILDTDGYQTPLGVVPLDQAVIKKLHQNPQVHEEPALHEREHSLEIQLPFLQRVLEPGWQLVPILLATMQNADYLEAAEALRPLLDEETLLVVSTDFTHYGAAFRYLPFPADVRIAKRLRELDTGAFRHLTAKDPEGFLNYRHDTGITICGYRAVALLLHLLPPESEVQLLQYTTSGGLNGNYSHSVSYIAAVVTAAAQPEDKKIVDSDREHSLN
jgi:AmmeMemoRadiSam system protein B